MSYDQARWSEDDQYEPLLSEKCNREVDVDAPLPDDLTRDSLELPARSAPADRKSVV